MRRLMPESSLVLDVGAGKIGNRVVGRIVTVKSSRRSPEGRHLLVETGRVDGDPISTYTFLVAIRLRARHP